MINRDNIFSACQLNIDGLSPHSTIAVNKFIKDKNVTLLALQEVGKTIPSVDIFPGMLTFGVSNVRGVSLSIAKEHLPHHVPEIEDKNVDAVSVLCSINKLSVLVVSCYCRPEISSVKSLKDLISYINKAWAWCKKSRVKSMLVLGDFNARSPNWGDSLENQRGKTLSEFIESSPEIRLHSSGRNTFLHSKGGSVIDLSISFGIVSSLLSTPYPEHCYTLFTGAPTKGHIPVIQNLVVGKPTASKRKQTVFNYEDANWEKWSEELNAACQEVLSSEKDAKELFNHFERKLNECNKRNIPLKTICEHSKPFWSANLSKLSEDLQHANVRYKNRSDPVNKAVLESCKLEFQNAIVKEKNSWIHKELEGLNTSECIEFWKRYKKQFVQKEANFIGHLYKDDKNKTLLTEDCQKEEALYNSFFTGDHLKDCSFDEDYYSMINHEIDQLRENNWEIPNDSMVENGIQEHRSDIENGNKDSSSEHHTFAESYDSSYLNNEIEVDEVKQSIKAQKTAGKCCDKDGFHPLLLKKLPINAINLLTVIYNKVLKTGNWIWNSSLVIFVRKANKESYLLPGSYRPLTVSSYIGKIMERVMQKRLILYCQQNNVIDSAQEGFLPNKNTSRYLYQMTASIMEARRQKLQAMLLLIDFQKAFDSVPVSSMIFKLRQHGINGLFLRLIHSFLNSGTVNLKVNDFMGPQRSVGKYGLPQGSVLSPILFIIYVADLLIVQNLPENVIECTLIFKYADDGSVLITGKDTKDCQNKMQDICNYLSAWCFRWRLAVNCDKDKTEAIIIKSKNSPIQDSSIPKLRIGNNEIAYVGKSKVLGITIDDDLNFQKHAKATLSACWNTWHKLSGKTTRKHGLNCSSLTLLFKTAVLTKLLYASPVWLSYNQSTFKDFFARAMLRILGSQFYAPNPVSQVLLNLPPLAVIFELVVVKFYLKCLSQLDHIKSLILQLEETPRHPYYKHVIWTKNYFLWKKQDKKLTRSIVFTQIETSELFYSQQLMLKFQSKIWNVIISNNSIEHFIEDTELEWLTEEQISDLVKTENLPLNFIFQRADKRIDDTNMLDFLHGRCLRFQNFKKSVTKDITASSICLDCNEDDDSPFHKLFICEQFKGNFRDNLINQLKPENVAFYLIKVIFTTERDVAIAFKNQVKNICATSLFNDEYRPRSSPSQSLDQ